MPPQPSGVPQVQGVHFTADTRAAECVRGGARCAEVHSVLRVSHLWYHAAAQGHQSLLAVHSALPLAHIAVGGPLRQWWSWCGSTIAWTFRKPVESCTPWALLRSRWGTCWEASQLRRQLSQCPRQVESLPVRRWLRQLCQLLHEAHRRWGHGRWHHLRGRACRSPQQDTLLPCCATCVGLGRRWAAAQAAATAAGTEVQLPGRGGTGLRLRRGYSAHRPEQDQQHREHRATGADCKREICEGRGIAGHGDNDIVIATLSLPHGYMRHLIPTQVILSVSSVRYPVTNAEDLRLQEGFIYNINGLPRLLPAITQHCSMEREHISSPLLTYLTLL